MYKIRSNGTSPPTQVEFLKSIQENTERIKEEKDSISKHLETSKKIIQDLSHFKTELSQLQYEKKEWTQFLERRGGDLGVESPYALARLVSDQRMELATLKEEMGRLKANENNHLKQLDESENEFGGATERLKQTETELNSMKSKLLMLSRGKELAEKQMLLLREQLVSFL